MLMIAVSDDKIALLKRSAKENATMDVEHQHPIPFKIEDTPTPTQNNPLIFLLFLTGQRGFGATIKVYNILPQTSRSAPQR